MVGGLRLRLFAVSVVVILVAAVLTWAYGRDRIVSGERHRLHAQLESYAQVISAWPSADDPETIAGAIHHATHDEVAVEILDHLTPATEVAAARDGTIGSAVRDGRTFVAVATSRGTFRLSRSHRVIDDALSALRTRIWVGILIALAVAALMTFLASQLTRQALSQAVNSAQRVLRGQEARLTLPEDSHLAPLGQWFNYLADDARREREDLAEQRALLLAVLGEMKQGVVVLGPTRTIKVMSDLARTLLSLSSTPLGDALIDHVRVPEILELAASGAPASKDVKMSDRAMLRVHVVPLPGNSGNVLLLEDVTRVRQLESVRRDFVANVSHELRTPVSIIRANAELLVSGASGDATVADQMLDGIHRNAERLARLLTDLLDLSRLDAGSYRIELVALPAHRVAEQVLATVASAATAKGITCHLDDPSHALVVADATGLEQALMNLVDNAIKHVGANGNIWIAVGAEGSRVRVSVSDDGPGIAAIHRARIFEIFFRVDAGRSREQGGTGLGLAIAKHLVESMHGELGVEPREPAGTTFWIDLPGPAIG
jgi:two-component system phosphate regulon sensor histidine kinase PhoR